MEPIKAIELLNIAENKRREATNPIIAPIDDCIADLAFFSEIDLKKLGISDNFDSILEAVFGQSQRIREVCLNPSKFWTFTTRFAYLASNASEKLDLVEATIQRLRDDHKNLNLGQERFLKGITDATTIVALTAHGYLMWDSIQQKIAMCPLHWAESEILTKQKLL